MNDRRIVGVWKGQYPSKVGNKDFMDGVKAGVHMYARWKDSSMVVGIMDTPLKQVLKEIEDELGGEEDERDIFTV